ncbi:hypothetical protein Poli38472_005274 [Pythium oligandrum]|uniref:Crossover junction endonuclease MUS81-like HHH domain-containing protein n=1 Tax=Pythium oligandrum TaxID=41045 RepID=A0A8K1FHF1_PYTOL|nr:hypothetical protein Poli38472_005274 [Pythium oligandrum]|eukprot:TMW62656.1 hypothetical protein Poli38472_005274 [Pythium oligandrum]
MSREESKKAAKELVALCEKEGVKLPTNPINAMVEAGTMLNATKENGEFQMEKALKEMIVKFGQKETATTTTKKRKAPASKVKKEEKAPEDDGDDEDKPKAKKKRTKKKVKTEDDDDEASDEDGKKEKKARSKPTATCEDNQELADAFAELSGFEFKRGEKFKGGTWSKVAKAIRDHDEKISSGKQAQKLKGIGKSAAAKIDEFLETGTLETLEQFRAGNI